MSEYEVPLGSAFLTLVDPDRGAEAEFNRWYERDHFYDGVMLGPGVLAGARFLARDSEKASRVTDADPNRGTFLALYWFADNGAEFWPWCVTNIGALAEQGRMTAPGRVRTVWWLPEPWSLSADEDGVPAALALDRRYPAVVVAEIEAAAGERYRAGAASLLRHEGVALVVGATPQAVDFKTGPVAANGKLLTVWFLADSAAIAGFVGAHEKFVGELGNARTTWLSPFVATVPGTDTHLDRLWL